MFGWSWVTILSGMTDGDIKKKIEIERSRKTEMRWHTHPALEYLQFYLEQEEYKMFSGWGCLSLSFKALQFQLDETFYWYMRDPHPLFWLLELCLSCSLLDLFFNFPLSFVLVKLSLPASFKATLPKEQQISVFHMSQLFLKAKSTHL